MTTRIATQEDIQGVLALQKLNLYANLSEAARSNGFVTTPFSIPQLVQIITEDGLFVAEDKGVIIAYVFAGSWAYFEQWPIFNLMVSRFPLLTFKEWQITTQNSFQYGPICIDLAYRGQGVITAIFEEMRLVFVKKYPLSITFINKINTRSTVAHTKKLGWTIIDEFEFNNNNYLGLAFDMRQSVIG